MLKASARPAIRLRGVRQNNLKNFDLDLPLNQLIVVTGVSGSGKSSLAFDTLYAEGQRRYVETFSPYARQFFDRMDKPRVDSIEGIPPAIAIEQRNAVRTTRSTVGTMTEICDFMKVVWPHLARLHCRNCGRLVREDSPRQIWEGLTATPLSGARAESSHHVAKKGSPSPLPSPPGEGEASPVAGGGTSGASSSGRAVEVLVTFSLPLSERLSFRESLGLIANQGYQRVLIEGRIVRLEDLEKLHPNAARTGLITVIQDRLKLAAVSRSRFIEACEQAYHFGKGKLAIYPLGEEGVARAEPLRFSKGRHCAHCDLEYREPSPALFSFNNPLGACPECRGFGRIISIDYNLAMPDRTKTLAQGVVKPWQSGMSADCQRDLMKMCRHFEIPTNVPFNKLPKKWQDFVIDGEPGYGKDEEHQWPKAWYGVKGFFRWLESRAYKMHVRVLLSRYRAYTPCPVCEGQRFQPETLLYRLDPVGTRSTASVDTPGEVGRGGTRPYQLQGERGGDSITLSDFYRFSVTQAVAFMDRVAERHRSKANDPLTMALREVRSRLGYLADVGLGYLTLDRPTRSLSGGETERVNLTTCLGTRLVNTLFVLDEPSVGLHARDTERLVGILRRLQQSGNTVVVVEHEPSIMRAADEIVDLGPGQGETGGQIVYQGPGPEIVAAENSLTGQYLGGTKKTEVPVRRPVELRDVEDLGRYPRENFAGVVLNDQMAERGLSSPQQWPQEESGSEELTSAEARALLRTGKSALLTVAGASRNNLKNLTVQIPLGRLVCISGVSGSGKTTLMRDVLLPMLTARLGSNANATGQQAVADKDEESESSNEKNADADTEQESGGTDLGAEISGWEALSRVVLVDQTSLGRTPRSNPAVYVGAFNDIRDFFARSEEAQKAGLSSGAFSFNSALGQCQACRGAGFEKIEMQFLSDVFIRCQECDGRRYRPNVLEVKLSPKYWHTFGESLAQSHGWNSGNGKRERGNKARGRHAGDKPPEYSIADLLDATIEEGIRFLEGFPESGSARRAAAKLNLLREVGLGYLRLGQPINTLSGGESQRLKLVRHLAGVTEEDEVTSDKERTKDEGTAPSPPLAGEREKSRRATLVALRAKVRSVSSALRGGRSMEPFFTGGLLARIAGQDSDARVDSGSAETLQPRFASKPTLFLFDEPTTGLHFEDVRVLLKVFQRLVDAGNSVVVIEHNLDVIKSADWVIDLGPEAGEEGGRVVVAGTPEKVARCKGSHTGRYLGELIEIKNKSKIKSGSESRSMSKSGSKA